MAWRRRSPDEKPVQEDPRAYLLRVLGARDYSRAQLETKLRERGHSAENIAKAIGDLREAGLFKEDSFASARVRALLRKGYGPSWIRMRLRAAKVEVDDDLIFEAYAHLALNEADQIRELARKSLRSSRTRARLASDARETRNKISQGIVAKGHPHVLVKRILDEFFAAS